MKKLVLLGLVSTVLMSHAHAQIKKKENTKVSTNKKTEVATVPNTKMLEVKCCDANGNVQVWQKFTRSYSPADEILPVAIGFVSADPSAEGGFWISPQEYSTVEKLGTGHYKVRTSARTTPRASIIITPQSGTPKICTVKNLKGGAMEVYVFNLDGTPVDGAFAFMIIDPQNLFD